MPDILAQRIQPLLRLGLRHDIEIASRRQQQLRARERLQVPGEAAGRAANALRHRADLAIGGGEERQDAVGLAEVDAAQDHRLGGVDARMSHADMPLSWMERLR